jgi:hypothetical protein
MPTVNEEAGKRKEHARWKANGTNNTGSDRLNRIHRGLLHGRGLTDETIDKARLLSADKDKVTEYLGFNPSQSGAIIIPYVDPVNGYDWIYRARLDSPVRANGKEIKYLGAKGIPPRLYFPPGWGSLLQSQCPIIVTEGEFKALVAQQSGLPTLSVAGVWGWRMKNHEGQSVPIADFGLVKWHGRDVTLAFDNDITDKEPVQKAQIALAHEFYRLGVNKVLSLDLPYVEGAKLGLDDYINLFGLDSLLNVETYEIPSPYPRVKLWTGADLIAAEMTRPEPIVAGWGFRHGGNGIITGMGGRGKTTLLSQLALHLAAGTPLFGHGALGVSGPQRVAVYIAEDPLSEVRFRFKEQAQALGYGADVLARICFLDFGGRRISLENEADSTILFRALRECQADVAILDPLVAIHDSDENSNAAMRKVLDTLNPLAETGMAFFIAHHEPKNVDNPNGAARGASAIRDWARTMLRLTAHGKGESGSSRFTLDLDKANYGGTVWSLTLERIKDSYLFLVAEDKSTVSSMQVWETIGPDERWFTDVLKEICEKFTVSETTGARAIKKAQEQAVVIVGEKPNPDTGRNKKTIARGYGKVADDEE